MPDSPAATPAPLRIAYAQPAAPTATGPGSIVPTAPWLAGAVEDKLLGGAMPLTPAQGLRLFEANGLLIGHGRVPCRAGNASAVTRELYERVLAAVRGRHLYRVWNFLPGINQVAAGLENYRAFCEGRSLAFEQEFGPGFRRALSAASAVGCDGAELDVIFAAGMVSPEHFENPEQMPAYDYPLEHGPRPPSFARATRVRLDGRSYMFISGTSAIKGHRTISGPLLEQLECTLDNLRLISREVGEGERLGFEGIGQRHFKVYLRRARDLAATKSVLERALIRPDDCVTYLRSDICRAALDLEIEATLVQ